MLEFEENKLKAPESWKEKIANWWKASDKLDFWEESIYINYHLLKSVEEVFMQVTQILKLWDDYLSQFRTEDWRVKFAKFFTDLLLRNELIEKLDGDIKKALEYFSLEFSNVVLDLSWPGWELHDKLKDPKK